MNPLPEILPPPSIPSNVSPSAKWLSGEGAGSWFEIKKTNNNKNFMVKRYSPKGKLECSGNFVADKEIYLQKDFQLTYPSFCNKISLIQNQKVVTLNLK